jgi:hypothetical protein
MIALSILFLFGLIAICWILCYFLVKIDHGLDEGMSFRQIFCKHDWLYNNEITKYASLRICKKCGFSESNHGNGVLALLNDNLERNKIYPKNRNNGVECNVYKNIRTRN